MCDFFTALLNSFGDNKNTSAVFLVLLIYKFPTSDKDIKLFFLFIIYLNYYI